MFKYRLKEANNQQKSFQDDRIRVFDEIVKDIELIRDSLFKAKQQTIQYYKQNPESFDVLISTDIIKDYLNDIKTLLK